VSCESTTNPDKVAIEFTRLFFTQAAHSRDSDNSKNNKGNLDLVLKAISPFKNGMCTESVVKDIAEFYEEPLMPVFQYPANFYANDDYKIMAKFNEGSHVKYHVAAMNFSNKKEQTPGRCFLRCIMTSPVCFIL
jgi:hypothetical protein